jgi:hypothetical protein
MQPLRKDTSKFTEIKETTPPKNMLDDCVSKIESQNSLNSKTHPERELLVELKP